MKRNSIITLFVLALGGLYLLDGSFAAEQKKEELKIVNKIITIDSEGTRPVTLTSQPGTTVIWVNNSRFPIEILFLDKQVTLSCGSPVNFFIGEDKTYESNKIPSGGTASLCFMEGGTYDYKIKSSQTFYTGRIQKGEKGTVIIK
jgi:plastocyanin